MSRATKLTPQNIGFGSQRQTQPPPDLLTAPLGTTSPAMKAHNDLPRQTASKQNLSLSFNVPFSSTLSGPDPDDIVHATPGAFMRWTLPAGTEEDLPIHKLPVHTGNVERLRAMCKAMSDSSDGRLVSTITSSEPRPIPGLQRGPLKALVTNVVLSGEPDLVRRTRSRILNDTPIVLVRREGSKIKIES